MFTPTSMNSKGSIDSDSEQTDSDDMTDLGSSERANSDLFVSPTTNRREISPCSVTTPSTIDQFYTPSEKILSNCCCMFAEIQSELRRVQGNATCCDCGAPEPQWASVTLASLVCIQCAGMHRALGVTKSRIRSLQMDSWSRSQVLRMLMGGNSRLKHAFAAAGEAFDALDVSNRYTGELADEYVASLNTRCPPATPVTPAPTIFGDGDVEILSRLRATSLRERVSSLDSLDESTPKISIENIPEIRSPTHRAYCPCTSGQRWTHLPSIAGEQRRMPILCTTRVEDKNCIVSSFDKLKSVMLRICW